MVGHETAVYDNTAPATMNLIDFIGLSLRANSKPALMAALEEFLVERKVEMWSYHILMEHLIGLQMDKGYIFTTYPEDWVELYSQGRYFEFDPIIAHARIADEPFPWWSVAEHDGLTARQRDYLTMARSRLLNGYGVPVRGALGTVAYFGVGGRTSLLELDRAQQITIQLACHQTHTRFVQLNGALEAPPPKLTRREIEVLTWAARGKSNSVIAQILQISEHTVNTLLRRVFRKFEVTDRVSAILRAVGCGLVTP